MNIQLQFKVTYLNLWPLTAEVRARSQASPCGACDGQSGTGTDSSPSASILPLSVSFHHVPTSFSFTCCSYHKYKRRKAGNIPTSNALSKLGGGGTRQQSTFNLSESTKFSQFTQFKWRRRKRNKAFSKGITQPLPP